jgi:hypothetical protein
MIRAVLAFRGACGSQLVERCSLITCVQRGFLSEVWVKCSTSDDMLLDVESALNKGYLLEEVSFLTGVKVKGYMISREIVENNIVQNLLVDGEVEFEYNKPVGEWAFKLDVARLTIDLTTRKATALLARPVSVETLFDLALRLLKPKRIPP